MQKLDRFWLSVLLFALGCAACAPFPTPSPTSPPTVTPLPTAQAGGVLPGCNLPPIVVPTAAPTPGYAELDPSTGLHYTGSVQRIDLATYRLVVDGLVDYPLRLSLDEIRCLPKIEVKTTIVCKGNFDDTATWAGASLKYTLELAGVQPQAENLRLYGADGYHPSVSLTDALAGKAFLAYEWEGQPVPVIHGFPLRAAFPGLLGANWVKWLLRIEVY